jgi:hypothetical protein
MIIGTGSLPGTETLPGRGHELTDMSRVATSTITTRRSLKKARKEPTRGGVTAELQKQRAISHEMINGPTDKTGACGASIQGSK